MADEIEYTSLSGQRVSATYKGLLHFPRSVNQYLSKQYVYDGNGTKTSLQIGAGTNGIEIDGDLVINGGSSVSKNLNIVGNLTVNGTLSSPNTTTFNDLTINKTGDPITLRSLNQIEAGNLRIRETEGDYDLFFGNPNAGNNANLFTLKVDSVNNNFHIKHVYTEANDQSPFWINRTTGEVNIKKLKTDSITNNTFVNGKNANRNSVAVGEVKMFAASAAPDGYLKCNGSVYKISDYPQLYDVIKQTHKTLTTFDTTTEFQVPVIADLQTNLVIYTIKW